MRNKIAEKKQPSMFDVRCSRGNQKGMGKGQSIVEFWMSSIYAQTPGVVLSPCVADTRYKVDTVYSPLQSIHCTVYTGQKKTTIPAGTELALTSGTILFTITKPHDCYLIGLKVVN